jgi:magnesium chelatase subunit D
MTADADSRLSWSAALSAAAIFAVDPVGTGGIALRAAAGPVRSAWFDHLRALLGPKMAVRRVPSGVGDARLLGDLDLTATLASGRPVAETGLLTSADQGVVVLDMAERLPAASAARISAALDQGGLQLERNGLSFWSATRFGVVACDEGASDDEQPAAGLLDRLAFQVELERCSWRDLATDPGAATARIQQARDQLCRVVIAEDVLAALCAASFALGIESLRAPLLAARVARAAAALDGVDAVGPEHAACAARYVLAPRARMLPPPAEHADAPPDSADTEPAAPSGDDTLEARDLEAASMADIVLFAARAELPPQLLESISRGTAPRTGGAASAGRAGLQVRSRLRGRPIGSRSGDPGRGSRLDLIETLRAAAPWQALRRRAAGAGIPATRVEVRRQDFRIVRFAQRSRTTVIFIVDASGSAALNRLAEAKGAVELFLADCYVRRDQVALIAFRDKGAELLLPPTRALVRARRCLASVAGAGGTPIASGLVAASTVAEAVRQRGEVPLLVLLTDGKANVALDGGVSRTRAADDARLVARALRRRAIRSLLIDFSPRGEEQAAQLAAELGARYVPLPRAGAAPIAAAVRDALPKR